jgi:hypothetical protein
MEYQVWLRIFAVLFPIVCHAQNSVFKRASLCSLNVSHEDRVTLTLTDRDLQLDSKQPVVNIHILYSAISGMSYEKSAHHRLSQGAGIGVVSPGTGVIVGATKEKEHWLVIDYVERGDKARTVLRLDKKEYQKIISDLEQRTGKSVVVVTAAVKDLDPTDGSTDVDVALLFPPEQITAALIRAMQHFGCQVQKQDPSFIQCRRRSGNSAISGVGDENVVARLDAVITGTRLRITTEKVALRDRNWSTPIYQDMYRQLDKTK